MIEVMRDNQQSEVLNRVLGIGTSCGYQAAGLSLVAKEVYSIEHIKPLHELARSNLWLLRVANIRLHYGDGMLGLPQALLDQRAISGQLVVQLIQHISKFDWTSTTLEDCCFVLLRGRNCIN